MGTFETLNARLASGEATIGIIGLGYVGLPLAAALHKGGYRVLGFDIDQAKIRSLAEGRNYLRHLGDEMTQALARGGRFAATTDFSRLREPDAIIVCLPTPLGPHQEPDLSYVVNAGRDIGRTLRRGQLIVLESTSYPRTTRDDMVPAMLEARAQDAEPLTMGEDYFVAFSPEREDPGRKSHTTSTIPKLVGGLEPRATELATIMYKRGIQHVIPVSSAEVAEAAKILENVFRAVNIALVNELKMILTPMGIDVWEVIAAAATKPFGFMPFYPGPGLGGHCIPIDPFYLTWQAKRYGQYTRFIELAGQINNGMPHYVAERVGRALNEDGKSVRNADILVIGLAYKPNIDDVRESPAAEIIQIFEELGARVGYHDPHVPAFPRMRRHERELASTPLTPDRLAQADCVLIVTNHDAIDYNVIGRHARLVVDTRNVMGGVRDSRARIVKA